MYTCQSSLTNTQPSWQPTRYCLCCGVAAHRGDAATAVAKPAIFDTCVRSFRLAVPVSTTDPDASDALRKLQRGCIDLLGLCVATEVADIAAHNHQRASSRSRSVSHLCIVRRFFFSFFFFFLFFFLSFFLSFFALTFECLATSNKPSL